MANKLFPRHPDRWMHCRASWFREGQIKGPPEIPEDMKLLREAILGQVEFFADFGLRPDPHERVELADKVTPLIDYIMGRLDLMEESGEDPEVRIVGEIGQEDVAVFSKDTVALIALELGFRPESDDSWGPRVSLLDFLNDAGLTPTNMVAAIYQPNAAMANGFEPLTEVDLTKSDLEEANAKLGERLAELEDGLCDAAPGDHCHYCLARHDCRERIDMIERSLGAVADLEDALETTEVKGLSEETKLKILDAAPAVRRILDDIELWAVMSLKDRKEVPGWKLCRGSGRRAWTIKDNEKLIAKLKRAGVRQREMFNMTTPMTPNQVMSCVSDDVAVKVGKLVTKNPGKLRLARASHPAEDAMMSIDKLFGEEDD